MRQSQADALAAARRGLLEAEEENWRARQELNLVLSSSGRKALLRLRAFAGAVLTAVGHPLWTMRAAARRLLGRGRAAQCAALWRRLTKRTVLLRLTSIADQSSSAEAPDLIRWVGQVTIAGATCEALACCPDSQVVFRTRVTPGARFVTACAIAPDAPRRYPGGVVWFEVVLADAAGTWSASRRVECHPDRRWRDRQWRRIAIPVAPNLGPFELSVTLRTSRPPGCRVHNALWGEPRVEYRRPAAEIVNSIRALLSQLRHLGLRHAWRRLADRAGEDRTAQDYVRWLSRHQLTDEQLARLAQEAAALAYQPTFSVITPVYNTDPQWLRACIESVRQQVYPHWQLCLADDASTSKATWQVLREHETDPRLRITFLPSNLGISGASNAALAMATGDFVVVLDHDDELPKDALYQLAAFLNQQPDADLIYSDEDKLELDGTRCDPHFKPDWSPEHMLSCMYTCHLMAVRRALLEAVGGFREGFEGAQDYDLVLRLMERTSRIHHVAKVLYHWRKIPQSAASVATAKPWAHDAGRLALVDYLARNRIEGDVLPGAAPGLFRVRRRIQGRPLVSIVIPTTGRPARAGTRNLLADAVTSLVERTAYDAFEIVLVTDTADLTPAVTRALDRVRHQVIRYASDKPFNFSHKINVGARHARGEHLVFFNDDLEVASSEWLSALLEYSQMDEVGAVGAKLLYPDGRLQHVGIVLGVNGVAAHAFHQHPGSSPGYAASAITVRNFSAVTAACLMTRRHVLERVGGFDESYAVDFNDVDYCLRVRDVGYRVVFTPYAQLYHHESASFGARTQNPHDMARLRERWRAAIERDPYYNPNLSRHYPDYRLAMDDEA